MRKRIPTSKQTQKKRPYGQCKAMILLDSAPIRKQVLASYRSVEAALEQAQSTLAEFREKDTRAFQQWEATHFGTILARIHETQSSVNEADNLLNAINHYMLLAECSRSQAYLDLMNRRHEVMTREKNPNSDDAEGSFDEGFASFFQDEDSWEDDAPDTDIPMEFDVAEYDGLSRAHQREVERHYNALRQNMREASGMHFPDFKTFLRDKRNQQGASAPARHGPALREEEQIKALYRRLARALHPDGKEVHGTKELDLWHAAQAAYRQRDLKSLEAIATRYELTLAEDGAGLPIALIQSATREIQSVFRALKLDLLEAQHHPAWKFSRKKATHDSLAAQRRILLEADLRDLRRALSNKLQTFLTICSPYAPKKKPAAKRKPSRRKAH